VAAPVREARGGEEGARGRVWAVGARQPRLDLLVQLHSERLELLLQVVRRALHRRVHIGRRLLRRQLLMLLLLLLQPCALQAAVGGGAGSEGAETSWTPWEAGLGRRGAPQLAQRLLRALLLVAHLREHLLRRRGRAG
jgi:hypothetical protein